MLAACEMSPLLTSGVQYARIAVNSIRESLGMGNVDDAHMQVVLLPQSDFQEIYRIATGKVSTVLAFQSDQFPEVVITRDLYPDYYTAGMVLHELLHHHTEGRVIVSYVPEDGSSDRTVYVQERRVGLSVSGVRQERLQPGKRKWVVVPKDSGELINELPIYLYEAEFIKMLLKQKEYSNERAQLQIRRILMEIPGGFGSYCGTEISMEGKKWLIWYNWNNIHFTNEGSDTLGEYHTLCTQLVQDICKRCSDDGEVPLGQIWMEAKTHPRLQNVLRRRMNHSVSDGFYERLRRERSTEQVLNLLEEVQSGMYLSPK